MADAAADRPLLEVRNLTKHYSVRQQGLLKGGDVVRAVDDVSFTLGRGETLGIVGESGCGKSTLARALLRLVEPTGGEAHLGGQDIFKLSAGDMRRCRRRMQIIFQDPFSSLNPRMTVAEIVREPWVVFPDVLPKSDWKDRIADLLTRVGLGADDASRYPHQFSGGQRQRIGIARALAVKPDFLVCDEAVAALDVSIQAQVLNLFMELRKDLGLTYLFISHDLGVVEHLADRVAVMYLGRIVEMSPTAELFEKPNHPYTQALLAEIPRIDLRKRRFQPIKGEIPSPLDPPSGCHFHPRCPHATERCRTERPALKAIGPGHLSACHLNDVA